MNMVSKTNFAHKIKTASELKKILGPRPRKKKVIMCHGTFDIVHPGHIRHLLYAKTKATILVASLTSDIHIYKGKMRPYVPEDLRALNLAALELVDYVIIDKNSTPLENLEIIKPDFFAKGYEYIAGTVNTKTQDEIDVLDSYGGEIIFTPGDIIYSSSEIIENTPPFIGIEKLLTLMNVEKVTFNDLRKSITKLSGVKVHVVGDTIVDSYTKCIMAGGMTKTPTMSVSLKSKVDYIGGAGIVAKHLKAAGADVTFSTVLGDDDLGKFVLKELTNVGIKCLPIIDKTRPTTNKNAIVVQNYRLLKIDTLDNRSISDKIVLELQEHIKNSNCDIVTFCDFRHGIFNKSTIPNLTKSITNGTFKVADSQVASRWGNILEFQGFDLITPNEREARFALGDQDSVLRPLGNSLYEKSNCKTLILKCGDRGIITYRPSKLNKYRAFFNIESFANNVVDAVGAGDALLSYASLAMFVTKNEVIASILGNFAAGIECEHDGNQPVTQDLMLKKIDEIEKQTKYS